MLGSLLLISPVEAEAEPEAAPFPPEAAGRPGCCRHRQSTLMLMLMLTLQSMNKEVNKHLTGAVSRCGTSAKY